MLGRLGLDAKTIVWTIVLLAIAILYYSFPDQVKIGLRKLLELKLIYFLAWSMATIIFILHYFKFKKKHIVSETFITKKFGDFVDSLAAGIGYGTAITTSLTLIKGWYIQKFFNDVEYFKEFNSLDLWAVFAVMSFFLYYSIMKVVSVAREVYTAGGVETVLTKEKKEVISEEAAE